MTTSVLTEVSTEQAALNDQLGVRLFTAGFNPLTASDRELLVHGFPSRPDARTQPELAARWQEMMSRPWTVVQPQFELVPDMVHGPLRPARADEAELTGPNAVAVNWSGALAHPPSGDRVRSVSGEWSVPNEFAEGVIGTTAYGSQWIGIDGDGTPDLLQAGTETNHTVGGAITAYVWWEWVPLVSVKITNLGVHRGDTMYCLICVNTPKTASIYLANVTTGAMTSFNVTAPSGTSLVGNSAEWIVESPKVGDTQTTVGPFGVVYFDNAFASTVNNVSLDGGKADTLVTMVQSGVILSLPRELGPGALKLTHQPSPIPVA